ncbi:hypothetical protein TWF694_010849 [Orbilia ellipsospora]|uniref:INO80 complex subunit B-like conserved region domain-containing protein n=1 Tax=Orbilia ellipsospora TaxID=2528407 RepID=A0AAV9X787_9PEZI
MAFEVDRQPSHIRALNDTISTAPSYVPLTSPASKRKRDVLLYIPPISTNTSFNSSTTGSFGSDGACDGCDKSGGRGGVIEGSGQVEDSKCSCDGMSDEKKSGDGSGMDNSASAEVEVPSPRTKVANKLEGLTLAAGTSKEKESSKAAKVIKSWRKSSVGKFTGFLDQRSPGSQNTTKTEVTAPVGNDDEEDPDLMKTPRKKRATIPDSDIDMKVENAQVTPKKRKGNAKVTLTMFKEPEEVDMTAPEVPLKESVEEDSKNSDGKLADGPVTFVGSSKQPQAKGRLRSPPPTIEEDAPRGNGEEDTDSDPDETGIGYRPTAQQRELRNQKRMQQIKEYKARESREARARRTAERRRRNVTDRGESATSSTSSLLPSVQTEEVDEMADVQKSGAVKKVHFAD